MTYPCVTVRGEDLPEPFPGWDSREYSEGDEAVYYPTRFEINGEIGYVYFQWTSDECHEQRWINFDKVDSIDSYHEDERENQ